jgi:hypothetical protein
LIAEISQIRRGTAIYGLRKSRSGVKFIELVGSKAMFDYEMVDLKKGSIIVTDDLLMILIGNSKTGCFLLAAFAPNQLSIKFVGF